MSPRVKLAAFAIALVAVFAASFAVGGQLAPTDRPVGHEEHVS